MALRSLNFTVGESTQFESSVTLIIAHGEIAYGVQKFNQTTWLVSERSH